MERSGSSSAWALLTAIRFATLEIKLGLLRRAIERRYRPDQPRAPKGTPEGGQWTIEPSSAQQRRAPERIRVAQSDEDLDRYTANLLADELKGPPDNKGHAVARHVGKSSNELADLLMATRRLVGVNKTEQIYRALQAWGSFTTIAQAIELVSTALLANRGQVDRVVAGLSDQEVIRYDFGYSTGIEAYWVGIDSPPAVRPTYSVIVIIRSDPYSLRRYRVHTAYPTNRDPRREIVQ